MRDGCCVHTDSRDAAFSWLKYAFHVGASRRASRLPANGGKPVPGRQYLLLASSICVSAIFLKLSASSVSEETRRVAHACAHLTTRGTRHETTRKTRRTRGKKGTIEMPGRNGACPLHVSECLDLKSPNVGKLGFLLLPRYDRPRDYANFPITSWFR